MIMMRFDNLYYERNGRAFRVFKEGTWVLVGQVISAFGLFALVRLLTENLDPVRYGDLALTMTLAMLVSQCAMSGVIPGIMRFYPLAVERGDVSGYFRASVILITFGTFVALGLLSLVLLGLFVFARAELMFPVVLAVFFTQLSSISTAFSSIQNAARQRKIVAWHSMLEALLKLFLCWLAFQFFYPTTSVVIFSYIGALFLTVVSQGYFFSFVLAKDKSSFKLKNTHWIMRMWLFSRPFALINLFTWSQSNSDRWALERFSGTYGVGLLSALLQVGYTPINIAIGLLTTLIAPILNQRSGDGRDAERNASVARLSYQLLVLALAGTVIATGVAYCLHEWLFRFLVGEAFREVSSLLPWVVLAGGLFASGQIVATRLMSDMRTDVLLKPKIVTAICGATLNFVGAFWFGVAGVIFASVIFAALHLIWLCYLIIKKGA